MKYKVVATREAYQKYWDVTFDELLALAEGGTDGLEIGEYKDSTPQIDRDVSGGRKPVAVLIRCQRNGLCELYQQGWDA